MWLLPVLRVAMMPFRSIFFILGLSYHSFSQFWHFPQSLSLWCVQSWGWHLSSKFPLLLFSRIKWGLCVLSLDLHSENVMRKTLRLIYQHATVWAPLGNISVTVNQHDLQKAILWIYLFNILSNVSVFILFCTVLRFQNWISLLGSWFVSSYFQEGIALGLCWIEDDENPW